MKRLDVLAVIVIALSLTATVYATVSLIQQTPAITPPAIPALTSPCTNLVPEGTIQPVSGVILLDCGPAIPAFIVTNQNQAMFTPTFTLPAVTTGTVGPLIVSQTSNVCGNGTGFILTSGQALSLPSGQYDYCLGYGNFPATGGQSIPSFS